MKLTVGIDDRADVSEFLPAVVLKTFSKNLGEQATLKENILSDGYSHVKTNTNDVHTEIGNLIKCTPLLQVLSVPGGFPLHVLKAAVREARKGGDSLITMLKLPGAWGARNFQDLAGIGTLFPEIASLDMADVNPNLFEVGLEICAVPLLCKLKINCLIQQFGGSHMSTELLGTFVSNLLRACPVLQHLELNHGLFTHTNTQTNTCPPAIGKFTVHHMVVL